MLNWIVFNDPETPARGLLKGPRPPSSAFGLLLVYIGDWNQFAIAQVTEYSLSTSEHLDLNFIKNNITFRAEQRADLIWYSDKAMVLGAI